MPAWSPLLGTHSVLIRMWIAFSCPHGPHMQDYLEHVEQPMDLSQVGRKLRLGHYSLPLNFVKDMRLIFHNSYCYNDRSSKVSLVYCAVSGWGY
jgi:hypothetical protein